MTLSPQAPDFSALPERLAPLEFDPERDTDPHGDVDWRAYLEHYGIDFGSAYPDVRHRLGRLDLCGWRIACHYWLPERPEGTLVVVHGYFDHSALYGNAIRFGLERNLAVIAHDQPGHGLSSGKRLAITSFDRYGDVLEQLLRTLGDRFAGPRYALGQSMGGATLLNHLWRHGPALTGRTALLAPLILPRGWGLSRWLHTFLHRWVRQVPRAFTDSSHDPDFNRFLATLDPLQHRSVNVQWVGAMKEWNRQFRHWPERGDSVLMVQGTGDGTVDWRYNLQQIRRKLPNLRTRMIEGARHHLINESPIYRKQVFEALDSFFFD